MVCLNKSSYTLGILNLSSARRDMEKRIEEMSPIGNSLQIIRVPGRGTMRGFWTSWTAETSDLRMTPSEGMNPMFPKSPNISRIG